MAIVGESPLPANEEDRFHIVQESDPSELVQIERHAERILNEMFKGQELTREEIGNIAKAQRVALLDRFNNSSGYDISRVHVDSLIERIAATYLS